MQTRAAARGLRTGAAAVGAFAVQSPRPSLGFADSCSSPASCHGGPRFGACVDHPASVKQLKFWYVDFACFCPRSMSRSVPEAPLLILIVKTHPTRLRRQRDCLKCIGTTVRWRPPAMKQNRIRLAPCSSGSQVPFSPFSLLVAPRALPHCHHHSVTLPGTVLK